MIIISARFRGSELKQSRISFAISAAMKSMGRVREAEYKGTLGTVPHVNVVFVVEGSQGAPGFDTVRIGPFSQKDRCVQVDIAVPERDATAENLRDVIVRGLRGANAAAFHFFENKRMEYPLRAAEDLVTRVGAELVEFA